jgi:hypothetical protein
VETCDVCGKNLKVEERLQVPGPERRIRVHIDCAKTPEGIRLLGWATGGSLGKLPKPRD